MPSAVWRKTTAHVVAPAATWHLKPASCREDRRVATLSSSRGPKTRKGGHGPI
jgi:hypothetical protein